jgi:tRNA threonylcarbamoyladenosine biosynthesis protein TsaB
MILLAFETATEACSVALWVDGEVRERFELAPRRHAELALPWAEQLLAEAGIARSQLDAIAVGRGPGAFTGVRLGVALAQGIALALDRQVVPVSTLAALAMRAYPLLLSLAGEEEKKGSESFSASTTSGPWASCSTEDDSDPLFSFAAIDARMGEVYSAAYRIADSTAITLSQERVSTPDAIELPDADADARWLGVGTGFAAANGVLRRRLGARLHALDATALPHAADVAKLAAAAFARGEALPPERLEPAYLRDHVALTLAEQQARRDAR